MRFKAKPRVQAGDTRIVEEFLLLPYLYNGEWIWLERVRIEQQAERWYDPTCGACGVKWVDINLTPLK